MSDNKDDDERHKDENACTICCDGASNEKMRALPCAHVFHRGCIRQWTDGGKHTCPVCTSSFSVPTATERRENRDRALRCRIDRVLNLSSDEPNNPYLTVYGKDKSKNAMWNVCSIAIWMNIEKQWKVCIANNCLDGFAVYTTSEDNIIAFTLFCMLQSNRIYEVSIQNESFYGKNDHDVELARFIDGSAEGAAVATLEGMLRVLRDMTTTPKNARFVTVDIDSDLSDSDSEIN